MHKPILALLVTLTIAQAPPVDPPGGLQSISLPAVSESWQFSDAGNTYLVGKSTGKVVIIRGHQPAPVPKPEPDPPPVPTVKPLAWATLVLPTGRLTPELAALRTDAEIRSAISAKRAVFRSYLDTEADIDRLNFRQYLSSQLPLPLLVLQASDGTVIDVKTVTTKDQVIHAIKPD